MGDEISRAEALAHKPKSAMPGSADGPKSTISDLARGPQSIVPDSIESLFLSPAEEPLFRAVDPVSGKAYVVMGCVDAQSFVDEGMVILKDPSDAPLNAERFVAEHPASGRKYVVHGGAEARLMESAGFNIQSISFEHAKAVVEPSITFLEWTASDPTLVLESWGDKGKTARAGDVTRVMSKAEVSGRAAESMGRSSDVDVRMNRAQLKSMSYYCGAESHFWWPTIEAPANAASREAGSLKSAVLDYVEGSFTMVSESQVAAGRASAALDVLGLSAFEGKDGRTMLPETDPLRLAHEFFNPDAVQAKKASVKTGKFRLEAKRGSPSKRVK